MIILNKNEVNEIYVTLQDALPSDSGEYILFATNTVTNDTTAISMSRDNNGNNLRFDKFTINEASHSLDVGKYDYVIKDASGSIGEYGKLEVIGTEATASQYTKSDNTVTFYEKN